jgi:hypothetical protein
MFLIFLKKRLFFNWHNKLGIVSFSMAKKCRGQKVSFAMTGTCCGHKVSLGISGMFCGQKVGLHMAGMCIGKKSISVKLECVVVKKSVLV